MEDEEDKREVKQMNSSLLVFVVQILVVVVVVAVALLLLLLVLRWGGLSLSISCLFVPFFFFTAVFWP